MINTIVGICNTIVKTDCVKTVLIHVQLCVRSCLRMCSTRNQYNKVISALLFMSCILGYTNNVRYPRVNALLHVNKSRTRVLISNGYCNKLFELFE